MQGGVHLNVKNLRIFDKALSMHKRTLRAVILSKPSQDSFDSQNAKGFPFAQNDTGGRAEESLCKKQLTFYEILRLTER